ncbi:MAG: hypothetical protein B1H03_07125, partial [Planctomycetales bacterium 4484_113]
FARRGGDAITGRLEARARFGIGESEVAIISCLRLHRRHAPYKGLHDLLRLYKQLRAEKLQLQLVGEAAASKVPSHW